MDSGTTSPRNLRSVTQVCHETAQGVGDRGPTRPRGRGPFDEPPLVGRAGEFRQLMQRLKAANQGHGQVIVLSGPAGIGKTRLAEELAWRARRYGVQIAIGRCWRDGDAPPLWPWRMILRELGAPEGLLAEADTTDGRFARFVAMLEYLRGAPRSTAYLLVLDDAHAADSATLLLARFLARERRELRLCLLLTRRNDTEGRSVDGHELLAELERDAAVLQLAGLSAEAMRAYLCACGLATLSQELVQAIGALTQGNPLHLRSVIGRGRHGIETVLEGLEQTIARTLEQLATPDRRLIGLAALLGVQVAVHEVARVAETTPGVVAAALARAGALGIMIEQPGDRACFVHERVRDAALACLTLPEQLAAHARTTMLLMGSEPDRMLRRAHHAFAAARRSTTDAAIAVQTAREVAAALQMVDGFEPAAALLGRAVELFDTAALPGSAAALTGEWAEAVLACGHLAEARSLFHRAARVAEAEADPVALARAALGLGGVWVREHRLLAEAERVAALQRRALAALPPEATVLMTRLTVRLAAEEAYRGGPVQLVDAGVDAARRTGDARALAEALSLCHHALLTPEHSWRRLDVANELIAVAVPAGDGLLTLLGLCWRAVDLFLLGELTATAALMELRLRADTLHCRSILFIVRAMEVMLAIRAGQFQQAEEAASACYALGTEVGDADSLAYYGAHMAAIRAFQGREAELADLAGSIATSPTVIERERVFTFAAALCALRAGRPQQAQALLEGLRRDGLCSIRPSSAWLVTMLVVVELAAALSDSSIARAAYEALTPYADLPIMASLAVVCFGSVHRALGLAALTCGKLDMAIEHLHAAIAASQRLGHQPAVIQARAELALTYLQRSSSGDIRCGQVLLQEAIAEANGLGMTGLATRWQNVRATEARADMGDEHGMVHMTAAPHGGWRVALGNHIATVPDLIGMHHLARLVAEPNRDIPALALVVDSGTQPATGRHALLDSTAVAALRARIHALRQQSVLSAGEQDELEALTHELTRASGLGGRMRTFADMPERARTAVRKAVKRAIEQIASANPVVGQHLAEHIETGAVCRYRAEGHEGI